MKLIFILLMVHAISLMTVVKAQRDSNLFNKKLVVDLNKEILKTTHKLPEERRKLSIFPKNTQKFVVTSKPYSKVRTYTPRPIFMTKKTFMPVFKPSITTKEPVTTYPLMRSFDSVVDWPSRVSDSRIHQRIVEERHVNNNRGYKITQAKDFEVENQIKDDDEEISTGLPEFAEDELTKEIDNNIQVDFNTLSELDSGRIKRLAVYGHSVHDSWYFKNVARVPNGNPHEAEDEDEFIFLNNESPRSIKSSDVENTLPSSLYISSRSKRSSNVIEEETLATTESRFNVDREPRLNSDLVFKNIHA